MAEKFLQREQLNRIEKDNTNISSTTSVPFSSYSSGEKIHLSKQPKVDSSSSEVIQKIYDKLQELKVKHDLNPLSQDLSRENFSDDDSDKEPTTDELITQLENLTIEEDTFPSINRISNNRKVQFKSKKPYYPRPSLKQIYVLMFLMLFGNVRNILFHSPMSLILRNHKVLLKLGPWP